MVQPMGPRSLTSYRLVRLGYTTRRRADFTLRGWLYSLNGAPEADTGRCPGNASAREYGMVSIRRSNLPKEAVPDSGRQACPELVDETRARQPGGDPRRIWGDQSRAVLQLADAQGRPLGSCSLLRASGPAPMILGTLPRLSYFAYLVDIALAGAIMGPKVRHPTFLTGGHYHAMERKFPFDVSSHCPDP